MDGWLHRVLTLPDGAIASIARVVTVMGTFWVCAAIVAVVLKRQPTRLLAAVCALVVTRVVVSAAKQWFDRDRPPEIDRLVHVTGQAMPSGHAANAACIAMAIGLASPRLRWPAVVLAFAVGISRVVLGVHWASDVVAGWGVGLVISWACAQSASRVSRRFQPPSSLAAHGSSDAV